MWKLVFCCGGRCGNVASHFRHGVGCVDARETLRTRMLGSVGQKFLLFFDKNGVF